MPPSTYLSLLSTTPPNAHGPIPIPDLTPGLPPPPALTQAAATLSSSSSVPATPAQPPVHQAPAPAPVPAPAQAATQAPTQPPSRGVTFDPAMLSALIGGLSQSGKCHFDDPFCPSYIPHVHAARPDASLEDILVPEKIERFLTSESMCQLLDICSSLCYPHFKDAAARLLPLLPEGQNISIDDIRANIHSPQFSQVCCMRRELVIFHVVAYRLWACCRRRSSRGTWSFSACSLGLTRE